MKFRINPYDPYSKGAKLLAEELSKVVGYKVYRGKPKPNRIMYNWGKPNAIAVDKLASFNAFAANAVPCPNFTTDINVARTWLTAGFKVVARKLLKGSEGRGAVFVDKIADLPTAPLYVKYIPKKHEYRVHVLDNEVILVQEKRRRKGTKPDVKIRSHAHDWVFCTKDIIEPIDLRTVAIAAAQCTAGGYGAVDLVYNLAAGQSFALEVNTAPGLSPSSAKIYAQAINEKWGEQ